MTKEQELVIWKLVAAGFALVYLYKVTKANGGSLSGNNMGVRVHSDRIANLASQFVPQEYRQHARKLGTEVLNRVME